LEKIVSPRRRKKKGGKELGHHQVYLPKKKKRDLVLSSFHLPFADVNRVRG